MKRKGFTLVELLAVIVILAVISIITIPLIGNVIEDSRKKALEQSVYGLVESANYFTISNDGIYEFVFDETKKGETSRGEILDYKGEIDAEGKLYIDNDGNVSLCLENEKYYVYKNYNSGIYIGEMTGNGCTVGYDAITNKYVAMLDDGTGTITNVYTKEEVNSYIDNLQEQIDINESNINTLSTTINTNKSNIETIQSELNKYALQENLNNLNNYVKNDYVINPTTTFKDIKDNCTTGKTVYNNSSKIPSYGRGIILDIEENALSILLVDDDAGKNMYMWTLVGASDDTLISNASLKRITTDTDIESVTNLINANTTVITNIQSDIASIQSNVSNINSQLTASELTSLTLKDTITKTEIRPEHSFYIVRNGIAFFQITFRISDIVESSEDDAYPFAIHFPKSYINSFVYFGENESDTSKYTIRIQPDGNVRLDGTTGGEWRTVTGSYPVA